MKNSCIVLAGGFGTRLKSVLADTPKSLAPVNGFPFIERQVASLARRGVEKFIFSLGYRSEQIVASISEWSTSYNTQFIIESEPLGTGGAIKFAMSSFNLEETLVVNGDTFLSGTLSKMLEPLNFSKNEQVRCGLINVPDRKRYGGVDVSSEGLVTQFIEKGSSGSGLINAGIYRVGINAFEGVSETTFSFETQVLPSLCKQRHLSGEILSGKFIDIGVPEDYKLFCDQYQEFI